MICPLCDQPIISHLGTGRVGDQLVHGECCLAVWLTGRKVDQLPDPRAAGQEGGEAPGA